MGNLSISLLAEIYRRQGLTPDEILTKIVTGTGFSHDVVKAALKEREGG